MSESVGYLNLHKYAGLVCSVRGAVNRYVQGRDFRV